MKVFSVWLTETEAIWERIPEEVGFFAFWLLTYEDLGVTLSMFGVCGGFLFDVEVGVNVYLFLFMIKLAWNYPNKAGRSKIRGKSHI